MKKKKISFYTRLILLIRFKLIYKKLNYLIEHIRYV